MRRLLLVNLFLQSPEAVLPMTQEALSPSTNGCLSTEVARLGLGGSLLRGQADKTYP